MTPSLPFGDPNCGSRGQNSRDRATVPHDSGPGLPPLHQIIFFRHQQGPPPPFPAHLLTHMRTVQRAGSSGSMVAKGQEFIAGNL